MVSDEATFILVSISYCFLYSVDIASVDRRDAKREEETSVRVDQLVESYVTSDIHREIQQTCADSVASVVNHRRRSPLSNGPGWPRIMNTIIR